jgi:hypothetical protein
MDFDQHHGHQRKKWASPWADIDSLDISMSPQLDSTDDSALSNFKSWFDESPEEEMGDFVGSISKLKGRRAGTYGYGVDAKRSAKYRVYDTTQSDILQELRNIYGIVTKEMLCDLIGASINSCPLSLRPSPPTRAQKRAKGGLVAWIDDHTPLVASFLQLHRISV